MKKLLLLLTLAVGLWTLDVHGSTYYVSKTANGAHASDSTNCSTTDSDATNKLTIRWGISCLASGDTLSIHAGTYAENIDTNSVAIPSGTSFAMATTIASYPAETATIQPSSGCNGCAAIALAVSAIQPVLKYIILDRLKIVVNSASDLGISIFSGGTVPFPASFIRVQNTEITNFGGPAEADRANCGHGVEVHAANNEFLNMTVHDANTTCGDSHGFYVNGASNLVDHCLIYNFTGYGLQFYNSTGGANNNTIRFCQIHDNSSSIVARGAIALYQGTGSVAYNNIIWSVLGAGIVIGGSGVNVGVYNNTVNNAPGSYSIQAGATNPLIQNNIFYPGGTQDLGHSSGTISFNLLTNPTWVNSVTHDYHLQSSSAAKDTGTTIVLVTTDYDGFTRPQPAGGAYDIGAYEYVTIPPPTSTISMTYPNGGENIVVGTAVNLTWTSNDTHTVKLEASRDGGVTYPELIATGVTQTADANNLYSWTPTAPQSYITKIRVTNLFDLVSDASDAVCNIRGKNIK